MTTSNPPDEKSIEVVFAAYAARLAQEMGKTLITFAPSQIREKTLGYDSKLIGTECRELYIQFKKSSAHNYGLAFHPSDKAQLETLKIKYPPLSAFYVAASFADDHALLSGQHILSSAEFLDRYFAVDVQALERDSNSVRFNEAILNQKKNIEDYPNHGHERDRNGIGRPLWLTGCELLCGFLGCDCTPTTGGAAHSTVFSSATPHIGNRLAVRNGRVVRLKSGVGLNYPQDVYDRWWLDRDNEPIFPSDEINLMLRMCD